MEAKGGEGSRQREKVGKGEIRGNEGKKGVNVAAMKSHELCNSCALRFDR